MQLSHALLVKLKSPKSLFSNVVLVMVFVFFRNMCG